MSFHIKQTKALNLNQRIMVTAVIEHNKKYLLLKRSKHHRVQMGKWQFPEGGVEFGERPVAALKRELGEETGLKVKDAKLVAINTYIVRALSTDIYHIIRLIFKVETSGKVKLSSEHSEAGWFTKREISKLPLMWLRYASIKKML